ncbi:MAG: hypothetical protein COB53_08550 [Elusimicrobia bacterium]|nr:MAG: hypothetical protein COB53_08550 [Elusimicrobiota bacterium]
MKLLRTVIVVVVALVFAGAGPAQAASLKSMAKKLAKGLKGQENQKVAVLSFPYHDGSIGVGSTVIQERLTTYLAETGKVEVIERRLLDKVLGEMRLGSSGVVDSATAQKLGKILGAAAVVTGTLHDLPKTNKVEINARLVKTETAKILAANLVRVERSWVDRLPVIVRPLPPQPAVSNLSQIAILLDTSSSMDGLIDQAKTQLWKIVNELAETREDGEAVVEVALYEYGNSSLSTRAGYIRQVVPFTKDLDSLSEALFALRTNGGSEYAGQVIGRAVHDLSWSRKRGVYKAIFIAGNESFGQGPVNYRAAVRSAKSEGIFVNTIFCGSHQRGIAASWKDGAVLTGGDYFAIDQDRVAIAMVTPHDREIERLGRELSDTYVPLGSYGKKAKMRQRRATSAARSLAGASVERALFMAKPQYSQSADWDAVSKAAQGAAIAEDSLPAELREMDKKDREKTLKQKAEKRSRLQTKIRKLNKNRKEFLKNKRPAGGRASTSLGDAVLDAVQAQRQR